MRARAKRLEGLGLAVLLCAVLLCAGCVTAAHDVLAWNDTGTRAEAPSPRVHRGTRASPVPQEPLACGGQAVPAGWPDFSDHDSEARLAPFLTCTSPADYVALQERVDMPRLVESLTDWEAVRLGSLGPVREDAAGILNRKRLAFLLEATGTYGIAPAEVFVRFLLDSAHDEEVRELLFWLARDKQLEITLGQMPRARAELEARALKLSARPDRDFQPGDLLRGTGQALTELLTPEQAKNARYTRYTRQRGQLPPSYQQDLDEVEREAATRHYSAGNVALGSVDHLTFGVPLGFYYLGAGTGHGLYSLSRGEYEEAIRELTPVALLATLYVGGKGVRTLPIQRGLETVRGRVGLLTERTRQLQARLGTGVEGLRDLARYIQASREASRFVAVGGEDAALALYEARGDVTRARPLLAKARPGATEAPLWKERPGTLASLVEEGVGHTPAVVETKLAVVEREATGPRLPRDVSVLEKHRPSLDAPPLEARGDSRWREYVNYYEKRLKEVEEGTATEGPLKWAPYERMRVWFARGLAFERDMVKRLREDAKKPRTERRFLGDFDRPRVETQVGVSKPGSGLRYADVLVIEEGATGGQPRRVETFSFKSRDFVLLEEEVMSAQMMADANEALWKYGETLNIRRSALQPLLPGSSEVQILRVRLIYERGALKPRDTNRLQAAVRETKEEVPGVEVVFQ